MDIVVASDLHTRDPGTNALQPGSADASSAFRDLIERTQPKMVIVTGDLTDSGTKPQWERVQALLPGAYELVIVPGTPIMARDSYGAGKCWFR